MTVDFFINKNLKFIVKDSREPKDYLDRVGGRKYFDCNEQKNIVWNKVT